MKNTHTLKWILNRSKRFVPAIMIVCLLNIAIAIVLVEMARSSQNVIDIATGAHQGSFWLYAGLLFGFVFLEILFQVLISILTTHISGKLIISLKNDLFSSVVNKKYPQVFEHHSGDLLNRFTSDVEQVVSGTVHILPSVCSMITKIIVGMWALAAENATLAIIVVALGFLLPFLGRLLSKKYKSLHKLVQSTEGESRSFLQESFANIVVVKSFGGQFPILKKLGEYMHSNYKAKVKRNYISLFIQMGLFAIFSFGYYGILAWGAVQLHGGTISYGTLLFLLQLVSLLRAPLQNISGVIPQYFSMTASAERLIELENIDDERSPIPENEFACIKNGFKSIKADKLAFAYDDELILKNCSFDIKSRCITAVVGESGSGKSTLFKLLLGLYEPVGGSLTINGELPIDPSTRGLFSYVPQGNMILSGTIRDNITLYNTEISEDRIRAAADAAVIIDFINSLPQGLDTVLSERGSGLSEGQIQRIAIARALLFNAPVLLLDESTSALDEQTETQLLSNIKSMTDKTVIFITHRNTSLAVCDHIIRLKDKTFENVN